MSMYSNGDDRFEVQSNGNKVVKNGRLNISSTFIDFSGSISTPSTAAAIYRPADNTLAISTANVERLRVDSGGDVCIGTESSNSRLTLNSGGSANAVSIRNTTGGNGNVGILFSTQDHSGGREKAAIYHQETHGQAPVSYTHLTLPTICSV